MNEIFSEGCDVSITKYRPIRSIRQNKLLWLWLTCIEKETGNDRNWMKKYYCDKFLTTEEYIIKTPKGYITIEKTQGTSDLDTLKFKIFLDKIKQDAEQEFTTDPEKPFLLPNPEDIQFKYFYDHYNQYI